MKTFIFLFCLTILSHTVVSKPNKQAANQIVGTWKFSSQSKINDFQKVFANQADYQTEFFTFAPNNTFIHEFTDVNGNSVKTLNGKWKFTGNAITITYTGIDYSLISEYFYIGKDLVLGKNFNHVLFTRENTDFQDMASK